MKLPMTGSELRISGVLRDRSTNCATTTGRVGLHVLIHLLTVPVIYGAYYDTKHG